MSERDRWHHEPVMVEEVSAVLGPVPAGVVVDATVGGAGHARALLARREDLWLVGLDRDERAVAAATRALSPFGDRAVVRQARFDRLAEVVGELTAELAGRTGLGHELAERKGVTAVVFDLGVSSPQLDEGDRGFSYRREGPLDMRMDRGERLTAAEVVNTYPAERLARLLRRYGDERWATRIASAIVAARPLATTGELAAVVAAAIPAPARRRGGHPARRTFQALRIEVNDELAVLGPALDAALGLLLPGGRAAALAYHSGEDRIVKQRFTAAVTGGCTCPPALGCTCGARPTATWVFRGTRRPTTTEVARNRRAESARLRAVEALAPGVGGGES